MGVEINVPSVPGSSDISEKLSKQDLLDIATVTIVRHLFHTQGRSVKRIAKDLDLPEKIVMKYKDLDIPSDKQLRHVVSFISFSSYTVLKPVQELIEALCSDAKGWTLTDEMAKGKEPMELLELRRIHSLARGKTVNTLASLIKAWASLMEVLRRANSAGEQTAPTSYTFNIVDMDGDVKVNLKDKDGMKRINTGGDSLD
jgi:hypothetical protein